MGGGPRRRHEIAHPRLGRVQQAAHRRAFGRGEADGGPGARQPVGPVAQGDQPLQRLFGLAPIAGDGIDIAAVADQGGGGDLLHRARHAASARVHGVGRQAPAGIEGRPETADRQAPQQGFEPQRRRDAIDGVHRRQQVGRPHVGVHQGDAGQVSDAAPLPARRHRRMAFDDQLGLRLVAPGGGDHGVETVLRRQAVADGGVAEGLVHDQDAAAGPQQAGVQRPAHIGLGDARADDPVDQDAGAGGHGGVAPGVGGLDQMFEAAGPGGVIIDAQVIDDQAEAGRPRLPQADRTEEAVFQRDIGAVVRVRPAATGGGGGLQAPAQHGLDLIARQAAQVVIVQEDVEKGNLQHAGRADPGGGFGGDVRGWGQGGSDGLSTRFRAVGGVGLECAYGPSPACGGSVRSWRAATRLTMGEVFLSKQDSPLRPWSGYAGRRATSPASGRGS